MIRAHIFVSGIVQGVYFRAFTRKKANEYNLKGWVRNLIDGRVEIVCEGEKGLILDFIKEIKIGPIGAHVTNVEVNFEEYQGEFKDFRIRYDWGE